MVDDKEKQSQEEDIVEIGATGGTLIKKEEEKFTTENDKC